MFVFECLYNSGNGFSGRDGFLHTHATLSGRKYDQVGKGKGGWVVGGVMLNFTKRDFFRGNGEYSNNFRPSLFICKIVESFPSRRAHYTDLEARVRGECGSPRPAAKHLFNFKIIVLIVIE